MTKTNRKATNVSLSPELLEEAREYQINLSRAAEEGVRQALKLARREQWLKENAEAIEGWNKYIEANGLPLARFRMF